MSKHLISSFTAALAALVLSLAVLVSTPSAQAESPPAQPVITAPQIFSIVQVAYQKPDPSPPHTAPLTTVHRVLPKVVRKMAHKAPKAPMRHVQVVATSSDLEFQRCVTAHESLNAGLYKAVNRSGISTASGRYQFINSTWRAWLARAGYPDGKHYSRAYLAPPWVQDAVFFYGIRHGGRSAWGPDRC